MPPSDLEATCALPHRKNELLVAESGYFEGKYGRMFHVRLKKKNDKWKVEMLSVFRPLPQQHSSYSTPTSEHIEGIACIETSEDQIIVIMATRGGDGKRGMLVWGMLDGLDTKLPIFTKLKEERIFDNTHSFGSRDASDLHLEKLCKKKWRIWTISVDDPGKDFGPFRSVIYSPGSFTWANNKGLQFNRTEPIVGWTRDGLKVEALAEPAERVRGSVLSIGTEDESLGGIWQPLFPNLSTEQQNAR